MPQQPAQSSSFALRVSSDPNLIKLFSRLKQPEYTIPIGYEKELKSLLDIKDVDKGLLISKITSVDDYQSQLKLMSILQHLLDRTHCINTDLYIICSKYKELYNVANKLILISYFDDLNLLKDGVRKLVMQVALQPITIGMDKLQHLIDLGESTHKHLIASTWNIKECSALIKEYLSMYKFGITQRVEVEEV